jgi:hypothetical protein
MHRHLGRIGAWNQICDPDHVEEALIVEPPAASHHLVMEHRDVSRRTTEGGEAESREK